MSPGDSAKRRLIVNADDLGRTEGINEGIFEAHEGGLVTSATLMVNYPASALAAARLDDYPGLGVGLHVALTGGVPTLDPVRVPSLVDAEGRLPPKPEGLGALNRREVEAEVTAQLDRFRELTGRLPTHLDSHHHSHRLPLVREVLLAVARQRSLPLRRVSKGPDLAFQRQGVRTTDYFEESFFGEATDSGTLSEILRGLPPGTTELMCHPARIDEELRAGSSYVEPREEELRSLTDSGIRSLIQEEAIALIHFGDL